MSRPADALSPAVGSRPVTHTGDPARASPWCAGISYYAIDRDLTLKQAALAKGVSEDLYDRVVDPLALTRGGTADLPQTAASTTQLRKEPSRYGPGRGAGAVCWRWPQAVSSS